jgi:hypothetical protein
LLKFSVASRFLSVAWMRYLTMHRTSHTKLTVGMTFSLKAKPDILLLSATVSLLGRQTKWHWKINLDKTKKGLWSHKMYTRSEENKFGNYSVKTLLNFLWAHQSTSNRGSRQSTACLRQRQSEWILIGLFTCKQSSAKWESLHLFSARKILRGPKCKLSEIQMSLRLQLRCHKTRPCLFCTKE